MIHVTLHPSKTKSRVRFWQCSMSQWPRGHKSVLGMGDYSSHSEKPFQFNCFICKHNESLLQILTVTSKTTLQNHQCQLLCLCRTILQAGWPALDWSAGIMNRWWLVDKTETGSLVAPSFTLWTVILNHSTVWLISSHHWLNSSILETFKPSNVR